MGASESQFESQPQQQQPQEPTRRESWLLYPQGETKPSNNSTKALDNNATSAVKPRSEKQTMMTPLKGPILPHNYELILKGADSPIDRSSSSGKLLDQLYAGVFLDHKTKKYWVEQSNSNCFMLYARALSITWAESPNYWKWVQQKEPSGTMIEVAELINVCWLEVHVKFDTRNLSAGIVYKISFVVMLKESGEGWELPINVRLVLPGGKKQQRKENMMEKARESWIEIPVGEFVTSEKYVGDMEISLYEYEGGMWKNGLLIKGVAIKPNNQETQIML